MQVVPIKTTLNAPGTKHLKLKYDEPPSNFAFKFNLRRYIKEMCGGKLPGNLVAGAYTRPLLGST